MMDFCNTRNPMTSPAHIVHHEYDHTAYYARSIQAHHTSLTIRETLRVDLSVVWTISGPAMVEPEDLEEICHLRRACKENIAMG